MSDQRYQRQNAAMKVDGYYMPPPGLLDRDACFQKAKAEVMKHLGDQMELIKSMTLDQFLQWRK